MKSAQKFKEMRNVANNWKAANDIEERYGLKELVQFGTNVKASFHFVNLNRPKKIRITPRCSKF